MTFTIAHEKFSGPLDFLLQEIEKEKLSVNEISLAQITDNFLNYIRILPKQRHNEIAEFLVITAQLLLIKSRSLLPNLELTPEEELSVEELENRLKALQKIREVMETLCQISITPKILFERESLAGREVIFYPPKKLTMEELALVFQEVLQAIPKPPILPKDELKKIISLEEKINELQQRMAERAVKLFSEVVKGVTDKTEIIVSFLAILELTRKRVLNLEQREHFGDIIIEKTKQAN